ncbi:MAG: PDZ domain-containing protein [Granulosicoccus sp.]
MSERNSERLVGNIVIAVVAATVASVLTLAASSYLGGNAATEVSASQITIDEAPAALGSSTDNTNPPDNHAEQLPTLAEIESMRADLDNAIASASAERSQLAGSLAQLTQKIEKLESDAFYESALPEGHSQFFTESSEALPAESETSSFTRRRSRLSSERTVEALLSAGLDVQTANDIQARRDQFQLARLELFDQATREGWVESDGFNDRLSELEDQRVNLREELGESAYDEYLFESGSNNRVGINSVINGSAAQLAGLQVGDVVMSYANERIFNTRELQASTRSGSRGEYVQVSFKRDGQMLSADLPRGPLGVTLRGTREAP